MYCLGCIDNRYGCLIIAFGEVCWIVTSFVFSLQGLRKAVNDWIMRINYYRETATDTESILLAGVGLGAALLSIFFTMMLAFVAYRKGKLKILLVPYVVKNIVVVTSECIIFYYRWITRYNEGAEIFERFFAALWITGIFGVLFPAYSAYIAILYYLEVTKRESVARKLYKAWKQRMKMAERIRSQLSARRGGGRGGKSGRGGKRGGGGRRGGRGRRRRRRRRRR